mmetsp:Transcript_23869/g.38364  ORF Transcript_23869/g.38364 Transcript_23869/m.38364 type:complete len:287 (-) Transcript_23869:139-999(-)
MKRKRVVHPTKGEVKSNSWKQPRTDARGEGTTSKKSMKGAWSFLKHPSKKDVTPRRRRKALDALPGEFEHLFIMDLEWTCDNIRSSFPLEIIEFSGVLVKQTPRKPGLTVVSEFSRYIKPEQNQALSNFCIELTGISQDQVDRGIRLDTCFAQLEEWLALHGIASASIDAKGNGQVAIVTWSDADCMSAIRRNCISLGLDYPARFTNWINLKELFKQHFRRKPTKGLKNEVEGLGLVFEGRAHSGIVDARNTAKIANRMSEEGFRFWRHTRNINILPASKRKKKSS